MTSFFDTEPISAIPCGKLTVGNGWRERSEAGTLVDPQEQMKMEEIEIVVLRDDALRDDVVVTGGQVSGVPFFAR